MLFFKKTLDTKGFSLVEIIIALTIIGLISAIAVNSISSIQRTGRDAQRQTDLRALQSALQQYYADNNKFPSTLDPIITNGGPFTNCTGKGSTPCTVTKTYLSSTPKDPSGTPYYYRPWADHPNNACGLLANGADPYSCHRYYLCAKLEDPPTGSSCFSASYNFQLAPL